ncbi:ATP-binding cassette domain-containing protein [Nonomuraea sp. H19]|uniref:ATP-binding cassette domain-containing protein n=1 Tax=Nonomuraea sp. H19 TaxID=3452206 RepID=UPI003F8A5F48
MPSSDRLAGDLQLHQLQLIEIGRALSSGADLILLDEPTASLDVEEADRLFQVLRHLTGQGIGFVLVSHRMHEIRQVGEVVTVLRDGRTVTDATPLTAIEDQRIVEEMFGEQPARERGRIHRPAGRIAPGGVRLRHPASGTQVELSRGEVLGLAGTPQGPAALADALLGLTRRPSWEIEIDGRPWRARSPRQAVRRGIGFVSGDRSAKGTFAALPIRDNAVVARQVVERRILRRPAEAAHVRRQLGELGFSGTDVHAPPSSLSGGTLQKVLIARWLGLPLRVLILEEPTRGVDVRTKSDLYGLIHSMAESGLIVIWWSTEHTELLTVADQMLTFTVTGEPHELLPAAEADEARLLQLTGTT